MWASEAPCSSISKNQMKSLKPGHHIAKILLFRTHHLWNSTTELILVTMCTTCTFFHKSWNLQYSWGFLILLLLSFDVAMPEREHVCSCFGNLGDLRAGPQFPFWRFAQQNYCTVGNSIEESYLLSVSIWFTDKERSQHQNTLVKW